jgi:hypothetical protein
MAARRRSAISDSDLFPPHHSHIITNNPVLTRLLQKIADKASEKVMLPWSAMQRSHLYADAAGIRSIEELNTTLLRFHVQLSPDELSLLYYSYPMGNGDRCDFRRIVATMFPTHTGAHVAPRYGDARTNEDEWIRDGESTQHHARSAIMRAHPSVSTTTQPVNFFGPRGYGDTWSTELRTEGQQNNRLAPIGLRQPHDLAKSTYPSNSALPPNYVWRADEQRHIQQRSDHREQLHAAFHVSRTDAEVESLAQQSAQRAYASNAPQQMEMARSYPSAIIASYRTIPSSSMRRTIPVEYSQTSLQRRTAQQAHSRLGAATSTSAPMFSASSASATSMMPGFRRTPNTVLAATGSHTYMLPIEHRASATSRAVASREAARAPSNNGIIGATAFGPIKAEGEKVNTWKDDTYTVPAIQYGQAFKF